MGRLGLDPTQGPELSAVVIALRERAKTLVEMAEASTIFYQDITGYDAKAASQLTPGILTALTDIHTRLETQTAWTTEALHTLVSEIADTHQLALGKLAQPLRAAVTGKTASPPIDVTLQLLGRERSLQRIGRALDYIRQQPG